MVEVVGFMNSGKEVNRGKKFMGCGRNEVLVVRCRVGEQRLVGVLKLAEHLNTREFELFHSFGLSKTTRKVLVNRVMWWKKKVLSQSIIH